MNESGSKRKGLLWLSAVVATGFALSGGLPRLAKRMPWSFESRLARLLGPPVGDREACVLSPDARRALDSLVSRIYPKLPGDDRIPLSIRIIPGNEVNAFAFLGGRIYVFSGLLRSAESPEELAGVLAHEIEHVRHRHVIEGLFVRLVTTGIFRAIFSGSSGAGAELAGDFMNLRFSRAQEHEADVEGLRRLRAGRVDPSGFARFFERLRRENPTDLALLSDHPGNEERARLAESMAGYPTEPILSASDWKALRSGCDSTVESGR